MENVILPRIAIRVDGDNGREAGMGHVYRSLAYANKLLKQIPFLEIHFFMREFPEGITKACADGYTVNVLPKDPTKNDYDFFFGKFQPDLLIIDTLGSSSALMEAIGRLNCPIITLDDLEPSAAEAQIIVNGILWATQWLPEIVGRAKVYQGVEYMMLRDQFASANQHSRNISPTVKEILISTGGADGRCFTLQFMEALTRLPFECHVNVMAGPAFKKGDEVKNAAESLSASVSFSVLENVSNMADYMMKADMALITGGTVMFESAACGTPSVIACSYEHQVPQAAWFHKHKAVINLGYFSNNVDKTLIAGTAEKLAKELPLRQEMSRLGKKLVDGKGMFRFIEIIKSQIKDHRENG